MTTPRIGPVGLTAVALAAALLLGSCAQRASDEETDPVPAPTLELGKAILDSPADDTDVRQCAILSGQANLPPDRTLILGVRNLGHSSPVRYFGAVDDWEYPQDLDQWQGRQWFGSGDSSVGQEFRVELLTIGLEEAKKAVRLSRAKDTGWHSGDNPPGTEVQAHITLKRVAGPGPAECS